MYNISLLPNLFATFFKKNFFPLSVSGLRTQKKAAFYSRSTNTHFAEKNGKKDFINKIIIIKSFQFKNLTMQRYV